jgi:hypothetical protein
MHGFLVRPVAHAQHTILLIQANRSLASRTFSDFESAQKALEG